MEYGEIKKRIEDAFALDFVGDYRFDEETKQGIIERARQAMALHISIRRGTTLQNIEEDFIFLAAVILAEGWSSEGSLSDVLREQLGGSDFRYQFVLKAVDRVCSRRSKFFLSVSGKPYYATIIGHAFSPTKSMEAFFDLLWKVYSKEMELSFEDGDEGWPRLIADAIKRRLPGDGPLDSESDLSVGSDCYKLFAGVTCLIRQEFNLAEQLIYRILKVFNDLYSNLPVEDEFRLESLIQDWWDKKEWGKTRSLPRKSLDKKERPAPTPKEIKPRYVYKPADSAICLHIGPFVPEKGGDEGIIVSVIIDGSISSEDELIISQDDLVRKTSPLDLDIDIARLKSLEVKIAEGDVVVYESGDALKRDFLLFDGSGREIVSGTYRPDDYYLLCQDTDDLFELPKDRWPIHGGYGIHPEPGEIVASNDRVIYFDPKPTGTDAHIVGKIADGSYALDDDGEKIPVLSGGLSVVFGAGQDISGLGIRIDDAVSPLISIDGQSPISLPPLSSGKKHSIAIFRYSDNAIVDALECVAFDNYSVKYDRDAYFADDADSVNACIEASSPSNLRILNKPPLVRYRIDGDDMRGHPFEKPIWKDEVTNASILYVEFPYGKAPMDLVWDDGTHLAQIPYSQREKGFLLGEVLHSLTNVKKTDILVKAGGTVLNIGSVFLKSGFYKNPISIDPVGKKISFDPSFFVGPDSPSFDVRIFSYTEVDERHLTPAGTERRVRVVPGPAVVDERVVNAHTWSLRAGKYEITVYPVAKSFFGESRGERVAWRLFMVGTPEEVEMIGKTVLLLRAMDEHGNWVRLKYEYRLVAFESCDGFYKCRLEIKGMNERYSRSIIGNMNPCAFKKIDGSHCSLRPKCPYPAVKNEGNGQFYFRMYDNALVASRLVPGAAKIKQFEYEMEDTDV